MRKTYFTADTHLGHKNIIRHCQRPFASLHEMNKTLIDNTNSIVQPDDTLIHCGDFAWKYPERYRDLIRCKNIILILGNHDRKNRNGQPHPHLYDLFSGVYLAYTILIDNQLLFCSHYAMRVWDRSHYRSYNLHGHSHGKLPNEGLRRLDVGVDCHDYRPISFEEIEIIMGEQHGRSDIKKIPRS